MVKQNKQNRLSLNDQTKQVELFSNTEVNKLLFTYNKLQCLIGQSQFYLLPQIRCHLSLRVEKSIFCKDSNITDNIKKVNNVQ